MGENRITLNSNKTELWHYHDYGRSMTWDPLGLMAVVRVGNWRLQPGDFYPASSNAVAEICYNETHSLV